jgi:hypothetical protein
MEAQYSGTDVRPSLRPRIIRIAARSLLPEHRQSEVDGARHYAVVGRCTPLCTSARVVSGGAHRTQRRLHLGRPGLLGVFGDAGQLRDFAQSCG